MMPHVRSVPAWLLACVCGCAAAPAVAATLTRAPFVQLVDQSSIRIVWLTSEPADSVVEYGLDTSYGSVQRTDDATTSHAVDLTQLAHATTYFYRVSSGGAVLAEGKSFRTAPRRADVTPFRFVVFGDSGGGTQAQLDVAARIAEAKPEFGLHIGDLVYTGKPSSELDHVYFDVYRDTIASAAFFPALGNKDVEFDAGAAFLDAFHLPENGPEPERYYSFVYANALFVALDSTSDLLPASQQLAWLRSTLAEASSDWKIVYFHHPIHGSGRSDAPHKAALDALFDEYAVDLVFQGHTHFYERTLPIRSDTPTDTSIGPEYVDPSGTFYVVTGGGGGTLATAEPKSFSAYYQSIHHFVRVEIEGLRLTLVAIDRGGKEIDTLRISKTPIPLSPIFHRGDADQNGQLQLTDAVRILNYLFVGAETPRCLESADADDNGEVQITDAVRILGYLFLGTEPLPLPGDPTNPCGPDPPGSPELACDSVSGC